MLHCFFKAVPIFSSGGEWGWGGSMCVERVKVRLSATKEKIQKINRVHTHTSLHSASPPHFTTIYTSVILVFGQVDSCNDKVCVWKFIDIPRYF